MINLKDSDAPLPELKISLPDHFADSAEKIYAAITKINETHNLTRITSEEDFKIRHLIDSISSVGYYPELGTEEIKILDLGCGGGFPCIPLAAFNPKLSITGVDSEGTKVRCVAQAAEEVGLSNLKTIHARGRELALKEEHKNQYDIVTARAVATADKLIKECRQFLKPKGRILLYKTPEAIKKEEKLTQREAKKFKFDIELSPIFTLPNDAGQRQFIVFHSQK